MAMMNPRGRANYEPNSWEPNLGGPRECHETGFRSFEAQESGPKVRQRSNTFADHYSQARQFYISQTKYEQGHIANALIFELSKVERLDIRTRVVSHLPNIDAELAERVAMGLGLAGPIQPLSPRVEPRTDLEPSAALSIIANGPGSFAGRKLGVLVTDGISKKQFESLRTTFENEGATVEVIAPAIGGVTCSDGSQLTAKQKIGGGPSVLYDAVALLVSEQGCASLLKSPAAKQFVSDAFAHLKFIGYVDAAMPLFEKAGVAGDMDEGFVHLSAAKDATNFLKSCRLLRNWDREAMLNN